MRVFPALLAVVTSVALAFLALPLLALFLRVPPGDLVAAIGSAPARDALVVSLETSAVAHALVLAFGTPAAYLLATRSFRGRSLAVALVELPLVLPPAVAGIALLAAFGRTGLLGGTLGTLGLSIPFTQAAVVLAVVFVESPFYVRGAIASFEALDTTVLDAARTLGARPGRLFGRIALPLAAGGLASASTLALARGLGEFGATIIFAGSLRGVTQTLPLAIYGELEGDFDVALAIGALFVLVGAALLLALKLVPAWTRSLSTSTSRSAPFASA